MFWLILFLIVWTIVSIFQMAYWVTLPNPPSWWKLLLCAPATLVVGILTGIYMLVEDKF